MLRKDRYQRGGEHSRLCGVQAAVSCLSVHGQSPAPVRILKFVGVAFSGTDHDAKCRSPISLTFICGDERFDSESVVLTLATGT